MSEGWKDKEAEERWLKKNRQLAYRVGNRFRRHVRTASRPNGKIIRPERCTLCPRTAGTVYANGLRIEIQAHHVDYNQPFLVLWVCQPCHRRIEKGTLRWKKRQLFDYTSLVNTRPQKWLDDVPF